MCIHVFIRNIRWNGHRVLSPWIDMSVYSSCVIFIINTCQSSERVVFSHLLVLEVVRQRWLAAFKLQTSCLAYNDNRTGKCSQVILYHGNRKPICPQVVRYTDNRKVTINTSYVIMPIAKVNVNRSHVIRTIENVIVHNSYIKTTIGRKKKSKSRTL